MQKITRRALVLTAALTALGASAQDAAQDAKRFDDNARAALVKLEQGLSKIGTPKAGGFSRVDLKLTGAPLVDVKRTDSVLEPVRATVDLTLVMSGAGPVETREEAETAQAKPFDQVRLQAVYLPDAGGWKLKQARTYWKGIGQWFEKPAGAEDVVPLFEVAPPAPAPAAQPSTRSRSAKSL